jgi:hypothetical protein
VNVPAARGDTEGKGALGNARSPPGRPRGKAAIFYFFFKNFSETTEAETTR